MKTVRLTAQDLHVEARSLDIEEIERYHLKDIRTINDYNICYIVIADKYKVLKETDVECDFRVGQVTNLVNERKEIANYENFSNLLLSRFESTMSDLEGKIDSKDLVVNESGLYFCGNVVVESISTDARVGSGSYILGVSVPKTKGVLGIYSNNIEHRKKYLVLQQLMSKGFSIIEKSIDESKLVKIEERFKILIDAGYELVQSFPAPKGSADMKYIFQNKDRRVVIVKYCSRYDIWVDGKFASECRGQAELERFFNLLLQGKV